MACLLKGNGWILRIAYILENYIGANEWQCCYSWSRCSYVCHNKPGRKTRTLWRIIWHHWMYDIAKVHTVYIRVQIYIYWLFSVWRLYFIINRSVVIIYICRIYRRYVFDTFMFWLEGGINNVHFTWRATHDSAHISSIICVNLPKLLTKQKMFLT